MKDFLIVYSSKTGNTEKVAKKFYEVAGERCDLAAVKQVPAVDDYKVIFAGYWVDKGEPDKDMQEFLQTLDNKKVVLFQTLGAEAYSEHGISSLANAGRYLSTGCKVVGTLSIRGAIDPTWKQFSNTEKIFEGKIYSEKCLSTKVKNGGRTQVLILMKQICKLQESIYKNLSLFMTGFINKICMDF